MVVILRGVNSVAEKELLKPDSCMLVGVRSMKRECRFQEMASSGKRA
jgi:hypothetical protein